MPLEDDIVDNDEGAPEPFGAALDGAHLRECAVLLDIDGTLLDLMPTPREVWVPAGLAKTLRRLHERTGGALAMVSGPSLNDIDLIFAPDQFPASVVTVRRCESAATAKPCGHAPDGQGTKRRLAAIAKLSPGILLEDKGYSLALHYASRRMRRRRFTRRCR